MAQSHLVSWISAFLHLAVAFSPTRFSTDLTNLDGGYRRYFEAQGMVVTFDRENLRPIVHLVMLDLQRSDRVFVYSVYV